MIRRRGVAAVVAVAAATVLAIVAPVSPVAAATAAPQREYVACVWERSDPLTTISCGKPFATAGTVTFAQCWRARPTNAQVQRRVDGEWQRTALRVRVYGSAPACAKSFPWKSVVSVPATKGMLNTRQVLRVYAPAVDGRAASQVQFGLCVIDERAVEPCSV